MKKPDTAGACAAADEEEVAANLAAVRIFANYAAASTFFALAESNAVAAERSLGFHRVWKQVFEEMAAEPRGAVQDRANELVVEMFAELDATITSMEAASAGSASNN